MRTDFQLSAFGHDLHLRVQKNVDLLASNYREERQSWKGGQLHNKRTHRVITPEENCWYKGHVLNRQGASNVGLSTCSGSVRGSINLHDSEQHLIIEPAHRHLTADELRPHLSRAQSKHSQNKFLAATEDPSVRTFAQSRMPSEESMHIVYLSSSVDHPTWGCGVTAAEESAAVHQHSHHHDHDHAHTHGKDDQPASRAGILDKLAADLNSALGRSGSRVSIKDNDSEGEGGGASEKKTSGQKWIELIIVNDNRRFLDFREVTSITLSITQHVYNMYLKVYLMALIICLSNTSSMYPPSCLTRLYISAIV